MHATAPPFFDRNATGITPLASLRTHNLDEAKARLSRIFRSHKIDFRTRNHNLAAEHEGFACGGVSFHYLKYGGSVRLVAPEMGAFYLFQLAISGAFRIYRDKIVADVGERQAYAVNTSETFVKDWDTDGRQLIVRVDKTTFDNYARAIAGFEKPILFDPVVVGDSCERLSSLAQYVRHLPNTPTKIGRQVEDLVVSTILFTFKSTVSDALMRPAAPCAPFYVKRVEDAIEAAPLANLSLEDLTRISGVSLRTLYYGFRRFRDTTPTMYIKNKRLDIAHEKLLAGDPRRTTVTSVALECGFAHLAKFAGNFRRRFGRSPSSVLRFKDR